MSGWIVTTGTRKILGLAESPSRIKAVFGGASASKTYSIIPILIDRAIKNDRKVITIVSDTARNLRDGAMRDFINIMKATNRWDRTCWNKTESKYTFKGSQTVIEFLGADEGDKFRGPRRDYLYVNEANRIKYETFDQMDARTRKEVWLDWNPTAPFWYDTEIKGRIKHDWIRLTYLDNESLSEQEIERFEMKKALAEKPDARPYDVNWWRVYGLGLNGMIEGACIKDYYFCHGAEGQFFDMDGNPLEGFHLCGIGLDFGNNDPNAAVALYKDDSGRFIVDEILYKPKLQIQAIYRVLKDYDTIIYADYAWPQTIMELKRLGLNIHKCKKGPDSIKNGIDLINEVELYVVRGSNNLATEFQTYRYKEDKDGQLVDGKYEGPDHLVDALRYVLTKNVKKRTLKVY